MPTAKHIPLNLQNVPFCDMSRLTLVWSLYLTSSQVGSHRPLSFLSARLSPVPPAFGFVVGHNNLKMKLFTTWKLGFPFLVSFVVSVCSHPKLLVVLSKPLVVLPTVSEGF